MSNESPNANRYSNEELAEFKVIIEQKLQKANEALKFILDQIEAITEVGSEGDWMDDTSNSNDLKMLYTMEGRHRKHIIDLENAMLRIKNKTYGVCLATGELIDKRRLMAVPTTTKSLEAKMIEANPPKKVNRPSTDEEKRIRKETKPVSIVKIKKKEVKSPEKINLKDPLDFVNDDLDDDFDDPFLGEDDFLADDINFDIDLDD
ncbi:MAG: hypothetical protein H6571_02410 [Lewinellaceae bacterium]|nr:hypothetical protein [Lewinellaceae bacterium]